MNYLHKFYLVEAEKARVLGQFLEAEEFYERAIAGAAENEYIQEEALAYELAAKHYLARGREKIAQTYMKEAHYCYDRWGATAKVKDIESRYPQFFSQSSRAASTSIPITAETITHPFHTAFDLAAVMKAAQAISREIELKQLLRSLMQILIENAGAQTGYLILENSGEWSIEAACELNADENACATQVLQSIPIAGQLPESIIQYVIRTLKPVALNDATREGAFINEPYIQQNQPQSIFCLPLLNQAKLVGVLYLENRLATGVFTPERSQVLQLLSTQAAIAIENANLYSELQAKESKITQFLEAIPVGIAIVDAAGRPYYTNQCGNQLRGKETDTSIAPEQISEAYQLYVAGTDQIYPAESLPAVRALRGERIRTEDIEIRRDHVSILIEARGTPVFDQQGNITYAIATFQDITERKQAEKLLADYNCTLEQQVAERTAALRQSEANYRNLLQTANSVIICYDTQGRIRYINDYGVKLLGYEEHQIVGRTLFETIIPDIETSGRDVKPFVHDLLRNPQLYPQGESENLCRDGRRVWMAWSNQAIFNDQGEVVEILSVGNDTTQRKQAEEALQRSEAKFRTIFENSQVGLYRTRLSDGLILDANQRFADLFGFDSPEEMIGLEHTTGYYVNPNVRQQAIEMMKRDGEVRSYEFQMRKRDGTVFWVLSSCYLNTADDYIEGVIADISDRKQAEAALQASEAELRALFSAIPDPLCVYNAEGQVIDAIPGNPSYGEEYIKEYIGKTLHQLYAKEQADEFLNYIQQVVKTQQVLTVEYTECQWIAGREVWFSARIAPIRHEQVIWLARDITLQKQAEEASILEERNRMAREIHDTLAQSFTGILAQVGAAKQVLSDDVEATGAHLDLIKELARTGLVEARRSVVALRPQLLEEGSLQSALHRLIAQIRTAAMDTTLYYEIEGAVYSLPTEVENNLLRMGQEALTNAIKHANADEIRVELAYDRDQVCLRVQDNGQGFGVGSIPSSDGFGLLGMSERAERIGAQLTIRSQPGQGTEIIVTVNRK
ncbi:PAS domain S-box protein [Trichocoleus sp. FACHB-90]|uniref:PAS domain S-box protein n=1 Tax=Cyanophyceae TaxID=3028117 RepID=UPI00322061FD